MPQPRIDITEGYDWRSEHQGVARRVRRLYEVSNFWADGSAPAAHAWRAGLGGLTQILAEARATGRRVRALGGGWSLSEIGATNDFLVNTLQLNARTVGLAGTLVAAGSPYRPSTLVFAQCGTSVIELNEALETRGLALRTSGASNGQSIAGAIATGTHGAAVGVGSMQDFVVGMHLLRPDGTTVWVERRTRPVASDALVDLLGAVPVRDDEAFRAALVGVGAFGVVHAVVFEAEPLYLLERYARRFDYQRVRPALATLDPTALGLPAAPFHFEVVLNPHAVDAGEQGAYARVMYKRPYDRPAPPSPASVVNTVAGDDLLGVIGLLTDVIPAAVPAAVAQIIARQVPLGEGTLATPGQTFGSTTVKGPGLSIEFGVDSADAPRAVDALVTVARDRAFPGIFGIRFVRATDALLGFTRLGSITATIEIPAVMRQSSHDTYAAFVDALDAAGILFTSHWGQELPSRYDLAHLRRGYGEDLERWVSQRRVLLPDAGDRRMLSNEVTDRYELGA